MGSSGENKEKEEEKEEEGKVTRSSGHNRVKVKKIVRGKGFLTFNRVYSANNIHHS